MAKAAFCTIAQSLVLLYVVSMAFLNISVNELLLIPTNLTMFEFSTSPFYMAASLLVLDLPLKVSHKLC